jgi:hypothetical protein
VLPTVEQVLHAPIRQRLCDLGWSLTGKHILLPAFKRRLALRSALVWGENFKDANRQEHGGFERLVADWTIHGADLR